MVFDEYEIKYLISKKAYDKLLKVFFDSDSITFEQVNYYYDTYDQKMRDKNITARIREKDGKLMAVIKDHSAGIEHSKETRFRAESVSNMITYNGEKLYLYGELYTKRTEINICDGITLMLDYNKYLGTEDYEMELEYVPEFKEKANGIILTLQAILGLMETPELSKSKSERFFIKLSDQSNMNHEGMAKNELGK